MNHFFKKIVWHYPLPTNDKITQQSSEDQNKTVGSKRAHTDNDNDIDNPIKNHKKKKIQTSWNGFFQKWINIIMLSYRDKL